MKQYSLTGFHLVRAGFSMSHALMQIHPGMQVLGRDGASIILQVHRKFVSDVDSSADQAYFFAIERIA